MTEQQPDDFVAMEKIAVGTILGALGVGAFLVAIGIRALDPAWAAGAPGGHGWFKIGLEAIAWLSEHTSPMIRGVILIGSGALCLAFAALGVLNNIYWREPRLIVDANGIESRADEGKGRLAWQDIASVRVIDDVLRVNGSGGTDIGVATGDIDKSTQEIFAAIARHRPELLPADSRAVAA